MTTPLLQVRGLEVAYTGAGLGVHGLDLDVHKGEVVALLGANGAGKSTTLRAISGFLPGDIARVTAGSIVFDGARMGHTSPHKRVRLGMSIVPEREKIFRTLTIEENLRVCMTSSKEHDAGETMDLIYTLFPALVERRSVSAGYLSGGERQMLAVGRALMTNPKLLLADEISLGIAPGLVVQMLDTLRRINKERGTTILVVEQNAAAALRVADRVYVLENGSAVLEGTPHDLLQRDDFFSVYFGLADSEARDLAEADTEHHGATVHTEGASR
jgi:branched-chain amino acid transport system ATP-binding protein